MSERLDYPTLYRQATGRVMLPEDVDELRSFLLLAPKALTESRTYVADLMIKQAQHRLLRETISKAGEEILTQVQARSQAVVEVMVEEAVERIYESSPSAQTAANKAFLRGLGLLVAAFGLAFFLFATLFAWGWIRPMWFTEESYAKINFAEAVQETVGGNVDWSRREPPFDESLIAILDFANVRGTNADPYHLLKLHQSCRAPGQTPYRSHGQDRCRYDLNLD
ncbi:hypothetical protein [Qipengyuania sp. NPDC077563]|uniref:hypothetical protein n=1 Tax=Qipengyuania sp. NPDC077563 TaxID=3364497 RepID=UPI00384B967C